MYVIGMDINLCVYVYIVKNGEGDRGRESF